MLLKMVPVYEYDELSDAVKEKLREEEKEFMSNSGDYSDELGLYFTHELEKLGYPVNNILYSLSYCQGDGMAFYGQIETDGLVKLRMRLLPSSGILSRVVLERVRFGIAENAGGHYHHSHTMTAGWELHYGSLTEKQEAAIEDLLEAIHQDVQEVSTTLEKKGYEIMEGMDSEERLDEEIRGREILYFASGEEFEDDGDGAAERDIVLDSLRLAA